MTDGGLMPGNSQCYIDLSVLCLLCLSVAQALLPVHLRLAEAEAAQASVPALPS
jgi:hypothetical protein